MGFERRTLFVARRLARRATVALAAGLVVLSSSATAGALGPSVNDPGFPLQWNLQAIGAPAAWAQGTGAGQTIAIVDSGVDLGQHDLAGKIVGHVSCLNTGGDPGGCTAGGAKDGADDNGHGTHVAGIAAAATDNGFGVAGVAPAASILSVKVLRQSCDSLSGCDATGTSDDVAAGIEYAATHGATVINLSLGNTTQSVLGPAFTQALQDAWAHGAIPVLAAGNDYVLPASVGSAPVIVVGALDRAGGKASYGNTIGNANWALMAPGGESDSANSCAHDPQGILSTYLDDQLACLAGTSMAAPHVAGAAAVLRSMGYSQADAVQRLLTTARPMGPGFGSGALDLAAATNGGAASPQAATAPASGATTAPPSPGSGGPSGDGATVAPGAAPSASGTSTSTNGSATTAPLPVIQLGGSQRVASPVRRGVSGDDLPAGPVAVAALLAAGVISACAWLLLRNASWARRTPPR